VGFACISLNFKGSNLPGRQTLGPATLAPAGSPRSSDQGALWEVSAVKALEPGRFEPEKREVSGGKVVGYGP
jgi:hypothetical protein